MPAPISFGARTGRDNNYVGVLKGEKESAIGPGEYRITGGIKAPKPSYAPFGTTEKRKFSGATPGKVSFVYTLPASIPSFSPHSS